MTRTLLIILLLLWILLGLWFCKTYICNNSNNELTKTTQRDVPPLIKNNNEWNVQDGSAFAFNSPNFISFNQSSFKSLAMEAGLTNKIGDLATYLKGNQDRGITITGKYSSEETNNSVLTTLGLARANDIKTLLQSKGVSAKQIELADELTSNSKFENNKLDHGIDFAFGPLSTNDDRLASIKSRLSGKPITLYFGTNQDQINLTSQQRTDFSDLNYYLDRVADAKLSVDGHTDNAGNRDYNVNLSKQRSIFVRDYLQKNGGIKANRMTTNGYGPDKPVSSNDTNEGKAKNRRVEVTLN